LTDVVTDQTVANAAAFGDAELLGLFDALAVPREIEHKMLNMLRQGRLSKWFSGIGQEAIAVGVAAALDSTDWILPMHRNLGVWTNRVGAGGDLDRLFLQLLGRDGGFTQGRDRTFHFGSREHRVVGMISHLGATMPTACGLTLAAQLRGEPTCAATFCGEGATSEGDVHEAMNLAAVWRLPVLFVIENNGYGLSTPTSEQFACERLVDRARGYGMAGEVVDGNDICAVVAAVRRAADRGRRGDGPTLLEFMTFRMRGHEETSGTAYVPDELFELWRQRDPILRLRHVLVERGIATEAELDARAEAIRAEMVARIDAAFAASPPSSDAERELAAVHAPSVAPRPRVTTSLTGDAGARYLDAISAAMRDAMADDPAVLLMGQDVAEYGGAFKATVGFVEQFGKHRVRNTPIIESGAIGAAIGLALDGYRPIVEMQFGDFISCGFNQVVNHLATTRYRWGAELPVVIRAPIGGGTGAGPFHSQNIEGWFGHVAGLKVVAPATPHDAYHLLRAAIDDPNPVLFLEHKRLYRTVTGAVDPADPVALGAARIVRPGTSATVVTYGGALGWCLAAADQLAGDTVNGRRIDAEVIDLRSLVPWDRDTVLASVARTARALVVHEAPRTGGFGGELAAEIGELAFAHLDAPVRRLGALDTPIPFHPALEQIHSPAARVADTIRDLCAW